MKRRHRLWSWFKRRVLRRKPPVVTEIPVVYEELIESPPWITTRRFQADGPRRSRMVNL